MRTRTSTFFEVGIRYLKTQENGLDKAVTERYVIDALSFTEGEGAITDEMAAYISGEFKVKSMSQASYKEIFFSDVDDDDKWYKAKLSFITIDEKTEREKRSNVNYLVQAKSLARALRYIDEVMGKTMNDYDVVALAETKVMDVFEHTVPRENKEEKNDDKEEAK